MSPEAMRVAIAKALLIKPKRLWRIWYDAEKQHGSVKLGTRELAVEFGEKAAAYWRESWDEEVIITEPEEYDGDRKINADSFEISIALISKQA